MINDSGDDVDRALALTAFVPISQGNHTFIPQRAALDGGNAAPVRPHAVGRVLSPAAPLSARDAALDLDWTNLQIGPV